MSNRGVAPLLGVVLLVSLTVVAATAVGTAVTMEPPKAGAGATASFATTADSTGEIRVTHRSGDAIAPAELRVRIRVDGVPLAEQPPVPFFAASGFESGPSGAFNSASAGPWSAGETASLRIATTNDPPLRPGATVEIRLYVEGSKIAVLEATVS